MATDSMMKKIDKIIEVFEDFILFGGPALDDAFSDNLINRTINPTALAGLWYDGRFDPKWYDGRFDPKRYDGTFDRKFANYYLPFGLPKKSIEEIIVKSMCMVSMHGGELDCFILHPDNKGTIPYRLTGPDGEIDIITSDKMPKDALYGVNIYSWEERDEYCIDYAAPDASCFYAKQNTTTCLACFSWEKPPPIVCTKPSTNVNVRIGDGTKTQEVAE